MYHLNCVRNDLVVSLVYHKQGVYSDIVWHWIYIGQSKVAIAISSSCRHRQNVDKNTTTFVIIIVFLVSACGPDYLN